MKQIKFLTMAALAATMAFSSCSNDDDVTKGGEIKKGAPTAMEFTVTMPRVQTYASTDPNATVDEIEMKSVKVLIYSESAIPGTFILEQISPLTSSDFEPVAGNPDTYKLSAGNKITTTTGSKKIYVAMNYNGTLPNVGTSTVDLAGHVNTLANANALSNTTDGFAMFSSEGKAATLVTETDVNYSTANKVTVKVKRMVAKISVQENTALRTLGKIISQGGELTNLQFAVGNANKTIFPLQKVDGGIVKDDNWLSFATGNFFNPSYALASTDYKAVDAAGATIAAGIHPVYAPENTAKTYDVDGKNLTYISVRAQYAPAFFCDATGTSKGANAAVNSFWTVVKSDGTVQYFDVESEATTYQAANAGSTKSIEYKDGLCYFRIYLNKSGTADATITGSTAAKFDVLRNNYYTTSIKSIKAPGSPIDEGKVTETSSIIVDVEVNPWQPVDDGDYDL